jgi:Fe-S cluster assembly protein SufD
MSSVSPRPLEGVVAGFLARYREDAAELAERQAAAALFAAAGLPDVREEAWHYTSLRPLAGVAFDEPAADVAPLLARLPDFAAPRLLFVNGVAQPWVPELASALLVRTGAPAWGRLARPASEKLVALNTMLARDGAAIEVAAGEDGGVLVLASLATGGSHHLRHHVRLGAASRLTLIELHASRGTCCNNPVFSIEVGAGAALTHLRIDQESPQTFHLSTLYAEVGAGGSYDSFLLASGGRLVRFEVHALLCGEKASAHLNAAQLLDGIQHADFTTVVRHAAKATLSRQTVKNVLAGRARAVFQGRIEVAPGAQKTDGYQRNETLLLSPEAEVNSKPELEIFADDVKCSHGSAVGELDAEQLFYLRSRGIPEAEARSLLVRAFLSEAIDPVAYAPARAVLESLVAAWWQGRAA